MTKKGAPNFKDTKGGFILGYIENKPIGENLDKVLKSEQARNTKCSHTQHHSDGTCISSGSTRTGSSARHATRLLREDRVAAVIKLLQGFCESTSADVRRRPAYKLSRRTGP